MINNSGNGLWDRIGLMPYPTRRILLICILVFFLNISNSARICTDYGLAAYALEMPWTIDLHVRACRLQSYSLICFFYSLGME